MEKTKNKINNLTLALNLNNKKLFFFPQDLLIMPKKILILELENNNLSQIPNEILLFTNLEILKLDNNKIKDIPEQLFSSLHLKQFSISRNLLINLPPSISF